MTQDITEQPPTDRIFCLAPYVVMEGFDEGALVLRLEDRHLFELNSVAHYILALTDGAHRVAEVAAALAAEFEIPAAEALADTMALYEQLSRDRLVIEARPHVEESESVNPASVRYIRNPDVALREEDEDGGLLFNPDTNQVRVVNTTGLFIWQQCDGSRAEADIVRALQDAFDEVPEDQVAQDVREFIADMVESGFLGTVESPAGG